MDHKFPKGRRLAAERELLIKWKGWSSATEDLTWEKQAQLIDEGHARLVLAYLQQKKLVLPNGLEGEAAAQTTTAEEEEEEEAQAPPPQQPPIHPVDRPALLSMLAAPIGSEKSNGVHARALKPGASLAQLRAYEKSHVTNPATGQVVHKASSITHLQKQKVDATPGAGRGRYVTGERQPIISEDAAGMGFACGQYYEVHVSEDGTPLNGGTEIVLEGMLGVGYACVRELRKLNGKTRVLRLSISSGDASGCSAVVFPLTERDDGRWVAGSGRLIPVLSLGRRVEASAGRGVLADTSRSPRPRSPPGGGRSTPGIWHLSSSRRSRWWRWRRT